MDKEALLEKLKDQLLPLLNQPGFEDALKGARAEYASKISQPLPRLKVMACNDGIVIATHDTVVEPEKTNNRILRVRRGEFVAVMRTCCDQSRYARLFAAAPEMLDALEALLDEADMGELDHNTKPIVERARAAIAKARG